MVSAKHWLFVLNAFYIFRCSYQHQFRGLRYLPESPKSRLGNLLNYFSYAQGLKQLSPEIRFRDFCKIQSFSGALKFSSLSRFPADFSITLKIINHFLILRSR